MQSYTTQAHQRNYQGNVVLPTITHGAQTQPKRRKALTGIVTTALALTVAVASGLFGSATLHSKTKPHLSAAIAITEQNTAQQTYNDERNYAPNYQTTVRERASLVHDEIQHDDGYDYTVRHYYDDNANNNENFTHRYINRQHNETDYDNDQEINRNQNRFSVRHQSDEFNADDDHENMQYDTKRPYHNKRLRRIPISEQEHETAPMPIPNHDHENSRNHNDNYNAN